jgi:hypothetical protein
MYLPSGWVAVIGLKGRLDLNNTNIFERRPQSQEFIIPNICTNPGADPETQRPGWGFRRRISLIGPALSRYNVKLLGL